MKTVCVWFLLCCKRYLRKASFFMILLLLPTASFFMRRLEKEEGQEVRIAVFAEGITEEDEGEDARGQQEPLETELLELLVQGDVEETGKRNKGLFQFYRCESEEDVKAQVASGRAECGYAISKDLRRRLDEKDYRRCIRVYSAPSTVLAELSTEVVFASLMRLYDREIFLGYVAEKMPQELEMMQELQLMPEAEDIGGPDALPEPVQAAKPNHMPESVQKAGDGFEALAGKLYDKWLNNGSTFRFEYRYQSEEGLENRDKTQAARVFPVRGLAAVYLLLTGLYSAVMLGWDEQKGLFAPLAPGKRLACRLAVLGAPVFLSSLSALGALLTGGCLQEIGREIWVMGIYVLAVCAFSYGVKAVCRKPQTVCCLIPLFLAGSLVFAPVLVDIRQFFPAWGWMEKLFLPAYYLRAF